MLLCYHLWVSYLMYASLVIGWVLCKPTLKNALVNLYVDLRVLNQHPEIQSFSAFNSIFNHSGLFGIHASSVRFSFLCKFQLEMTPCVYIYGVYWAPIDLVVFIWCLWLMASLKSIPAWCGTFALKFIISFFVSDVLLCIRLLWTFNWVC